LVILDILNLIKIIATITTTLIAVIIGIRVFLLNKNDWLNRWFALFFISSSIGFLIYSIYHLILNNAEIIIPLMITAQIFFNFNVIALVMTVLILEKYNKAAMSIRYFGTLILLFLVMSIGYFFFIPTLDITAYAEGIVDTNTPIGWLVVVNALRISLAIYVSAKYILIAKKLEDDTKNKINWFSVGVIVIIIGLFLNLAGGALLSPIVEILALLMIDIGSILILKAFLLT